MALLVEALKLTHDEKYEEAQKLRDRAFESAPATAGKIDDQPFAWLADADPRLGPMLEAVVNGRYYWIPVHRLREIRLEKPVDLRDLVWTPAQLTLANGGQSVALIPTRYSGTEQAEDPRLLMARSTEWSERPGGLHLGLGQRLFTTDVGEHSIMDVRVVTLEGSDSDAASEKAAGFENPATA
jgi:type VI secretion system protein ImpE